MWPIYRFTEWFDSWDICKPQAQRYGCPWKAEGSGRGPRKLGVNSRKYDVRRIGSQTMKWAGKPG